jgi:uncharacterized protein
MNILTTWLAGFWGMTAAMAPYLLFGFFMAGVLSVLLKPEFVAKHLGRRGFRQILKATAVGVPMPLCSCGVIPVAASLRNHGAGKGATTAFLASTPQMGVNSLMVSWGVLGWLFTLARVLAAFVSGLLAGVLVDHYDGDTETPDGNGGSEGPAGSGSWGLKFGRMLKYGFVTLPRDIGKSLLIGLLIAGAIGAFVPGGFISGYVESGFLVYVLLTVVAIPMYVCSTSSIPLALAFVHAGASPGGALVFLISGPATNAATISTIWKLLGRRTVLIYLGTIIAVSWIFGWLVDLFGLFSPVLLHAVTDHCAHGAFEVGHIWGVLLLLVLANALRPRKKAECSHCCKNEEVR